ncbi:DIP1984 family protein [Candidatus Pacearchaeota archaeon]|nr:DIP1984 family protein [Candidatus Pacearchaeota archaeon]
MEDMNLGEALSLLKKEKSRLARLINLRKDNVYVEDGKKSEFNPKNLSEEINVKIDEIRRLKIRITRTNLDSEISGEKINLAEAIIKVGDIRSKIAHLSNLFERKRGSWYSEKETKNFVAQLDEAEIENEIEKLEIEKAKLDNKIQMTNWNTKLLG